MTAPKVVKHSHLSLEADIPEALWHEHPMAAKHQHGRSGVSVTEAELIEAEAPKDEPDVGIAVIAETDPASKRLLSKLKGRKVGR